MPDTSNNAFRLSSWTIRPGIGEIEDGAGTKRHLEPKVMDVLVCLADGFPEVVSRDEILERVWAGVVVSDDALTRAIGELRRAFGDDSRQAKLVETVPKRGYRLLVPAEPVPRPSETSPTQTSESHDMPLRQTIVLVTISLFAIVGVVMVNVKEVEKAPIVDIRPTTPSIAVLPFDTVGIDPEDQYFVQGMHSEVITQLAALSFLDKVISATTMQRYRDSTLSLPEIARQLEVSTILEGQIRRSGDRLRFNVRLIDAVEEKRLWAESFDRELNNSSIFAIQNEIALAIADALEGTISTEEESRLAELPTLSQDAYDAYLLGHQAMARRQVNDLQRARAYFETAVSLDPDFVLAYAGLADSIGLLVLYGGAPESDYATARNAIETALRIDDNCGECYATVGYLAWRHARFQDSELVRAEVSFLRAQELVPHYAPAYQWYALLLIDMERKAEAVRQLQHAISLSPLDPNLHTDLGTAYGRMGRRDSAIESFNRALEIDREFAHAMSTLGSLHLFFREPHEAIRWYRRTLAIDPSNLHAIARMISAHAALGAHDEAQLWYRRLQETPDTFWKNAFSMVLPYSLAMYDEAEAAARDYLRETPGCRFCVEVIAYRENARGEYQAVIEMVQRYVPALLRQPAPEFDQKTLYVVPPLAVALQKTGRENEARKLLESALSYANTLPRLLMSERGRGIEDVRLYILLGRYGDAIAAFQDAYDQGWRFMYPVIESQLLDPILDDARMQALMARMEAERNAHYEEIFASAH